MNRAVLLATILFALAGGVAKAQLSLETPVATNMIMMFGCQKANCTTTCTGPGNEVSIQNYKILVVYQTVIHPQRVWLGTDQNKFYMLGADETCTFGGERASPLQFQGILPPSQLGSVKPGCVCLNGVCNIPGCAQ